MTPFSAIQSKEASFLRLNHFGDSALWRKPKRQLMMVQFCISFSGFLFKEVPAFYKGVLSGLPCRQKFSDQKHMHRKFFVLHFL